MSAQANFQASMVYTVPVIVNYTSTVVVLLVYCCYYAVIHVGTCRSNEIPGGISLVEVIVLWENDIVIERMLI